MPDCVNSGEYKGIWIAFVIMVASLSFVAKLVVAVSFIGMHRSEKSRQQQIITECLLRPCKSQFGIMPGSWLILVLAVSSAAALAHAATVEHTFNVLSHTHSLFFSFFKKRHSSQFA